MSELFCQACGGCREELRQGRRKRIVIQHGQLARLIDAAAVVRARLVIFAPDRIRLRITYANRRGLQTTKIGVGPKVNLDAAYSSPDGSHILLFVHSVVYLNWHHSSGVRPSEAGKQHVTFLADHGRPSNVAGQQRLHFGGGARGGDFTCQVKQL